MVEPQAPPPSRKDQLPPMLVCVTPCKMACTVKKPKVTSFWGVTDASGHMKAWPFWPNVRHSDRSFQLPGVQEENIFSSLPILGSLIGAQQIRLTEER